MSRAGQKSQRALRLASTCIEEVKELLGGVFLFLVLLVFLFRAGTFDRSEKGLSQQVATNSEAQEMRPAHQNDGPTSSPEKAIPNDVAASSEGASAEAEPRRAEEAQPTGETRRQADTDEDEQPVSVPIQVEPAERPTRPQPSPQKTARRLFGDGIHRFWEGKYDAAVERFIQASTLDRTDARMLYFLALAYRRMGKDRRAEEVLKIAVRVEARYPAENYGQLMQRVQGRERLWLEDARTRGGLS